MLKGWRPLRLVKREQGEREKGDRGATTEMLPFLDAVVPLSYFLRPSLRRHTCCPPRLLARSPFPAPSFRSPPVPRVGSRKSGLSVNLEVSFKTRFSGPQSLIGHWGQQDTPPAPPPASHHTTRTGNQRVTNLQDTGHR